MKNKAKKEDACPNNPDMINVAKKSKILLDFLKKTKIYPPYDIIPITATDEKYENPSNGE
jgi:hypothetical protein